MDVTPTPPQKRPTRATTGSKSSAATPPAASPKGAKPARGRKAGAPESPVESPLESPAESRAEYVATAHEIGDIGQRIATTAYFLAAARNFEPGHELEDWLEAERRERPGE